MNSHDPLCPLIGERTHVSLCPYCPVITKIRADERRRTAAAIEAKADDMYTEVGLTDYGDDRSWQRNADLSMCAGLRIAARIARSGGSDD